MKFLLVISTLLARIGFCSVGLAGVNIAGCDFGLDDQGSCYTPTSGCDGGCPTQAMASDQMFHFSKDYHMYIFRLPVAWQFLTNYKLGATLYAPWFKQYDGLVRTCLSTGAYCIVDLHNYARWQGMTIGQSNATGAPTNANFVSVWKQLATKYKNETKVIFGLMNEPHDLDMNVFANSLQLVVNGIRSVGAKSQLILLPGSEYSHPGNFPYYSGPILANIKDYDGSQDLLIYDIHQYYTSYGGEAAPCISNYINDGYAPLVSYLRDQGRYALVTETGGRNNAACVKYVCQALDYINANSDVFLGWVGWAAGSFDTSYQASETPFPNGTDQLLLKKCIAGKLDWSSKRFANDLSPRALLSYV